MVYFVIYFNMRVRETNVNAAFNVTDVNVQRITAQVPQMTEQERFTLSQQASAYNDYRLPFALISHTQDARTVAQISVRYPFMRWEGDGRAEVEAYLAQTTDKMLSWANKSLLVLLSLACNPNITEKVARMIIDANNEMGWMALMGNDAFWDLDSAPLYLYHKTDDVQAKRYINRKLNLNKYLLSTDDMVLTLFDQYLDDRCSDE